MPILLASEQAAIHLYGHAGFKPRSCRCATATSKFFDLLPKPDGQKCCYEQIMFPDEKRELVQEISEMKLHSNLVCAEGQVRPGQSWPLLRSCASSRGITRARTPSVIILSPM